MHGTWEGHARVQIQNDEPNTSIIPAALMEMLGILPLSPSGALVVAAPSKKGVWPSDKGLRVIQFLF
jgi:hypothetical protein